VIPGISRTRHPFRFPPTSTTWRRPSWSGWASPPAIAAAQFELRNFIDGKRSILDIRNAASAEYEPLRLVDVEAYMKFLEKLGMVEIRTSRTVFPVR
jgi:hypothetical protein